MKHASASDLYTKVAISVLTYVILNLPNLYFDLFNQSAPVYALNLCHISDVLLMYMLYQIFTIKFNRYDSKQKRVILFLSFTSLLIFFMADSNLLSSLNEEVIYYLYTVPLALGFLLLSLFSYREGRVLANHYFSLLPVLISVYSLLLLTQIPLLSAEVKIIGYLLKLLLMTTIHFIMYLDLKRSFYY